MHWEEKKLSWSFVLLLFLVKCFIFLSCSRSQVEAGVLSKPDFYKGTISTSVRQRVQRNQSLHPGDIIQGDIRVDARLIAMMAGHKRGAILSPKQHSFLWPVEMVQNKKTIRIPYEFRSGIFDGLSSKAQQAVEAAFDYLKKKTCIRFVSKNSKDKDFVEVFPGSGCWSEIGRRTGKQQISIDSGCEHKGHVLHELLHTIGFLHEQSRQDRDNYVKVMWDNIDKRRHSEFETMEQITEELPYDFKSVMHYKNNAFSNNDKDTIIALNDPQMVLGKRNDLSALDIMRVNKLYSCSDYIAQELVNYPIIVYTSNSWWAGTDATVDIEIVGKKGDSGESELASGGYDDDFERGSVHSFLYASPYLGTLKELKIRLIQKTWWDGWKLSKVVIKDPRNQRQFTFNYNNWIYPGSHKILKPT